jgi:hypothetical protein
MNRNKTNLAKKPFISLLWIYASVTQHEASLLSGLAPFKTVKSMCNCSLGYLVLGLKLVSFSFETVVTYHRKSLVVVSIIPERSYDMVD